MRRAESRTDGEGSSARTRTERRLRRLLSSTRVLTPPRRASIPRDSSVSAFLLCVALDEALHVLPRVGGRVLELLVLPVEEAVRRARVHVLLVLDARLLKRLVE